MSVLRENTFFKEKNETDFFVSYFLFNFYFGIMSRF